MKSEPKDIIRVIPAVKLPGGITQTFSYLVPPELSGIVPGSVVRVPFRRKEVLGVVESLGAIDEPGFKLKTVAGVLEDIALDPRQLELARFISRYYVTPLSLVIRLLLPPLTKEAPRKDIACSKNASLEDVPEELAGKAAGHLAEHDRTLLFHSLGAQRHALYLDLIRRQPDGAQTLLMMPEHLDLFASARFFIETLGRESVAVLAGGMTRNQFDAEWRKIHSGQARLVLSTRQGVFAPFCRLGLVIVDNEHDSSYKQWDQNPRYHGRDVALELARLWDARVVLSSSVPSLESWARIGSGLALLDLTREEEANLTVLDLMEERKMGSSAFLPERLRQRLLETVHGKDQALVFIPRLGEKTMHQCKDCGWVAECPACQSALVSFKERLFCPRCRTEHGAPNLCPACGGQNIKASGGGSQRVYSELEELFAGKNIRLSELDSSVASNGAERVRRDFEAGRIDVLVGTQMAWRGWSSPRLRTVAVIFPEIIFGAAGWRSKERAWQFLSRLYGFARHAETFVVTYKPEHKYFAEFKLEGVRSFLDRELLTRREGPSSIPYPPFGRLIKLIYKDPDARACQKETRWQYELLQRRLRELDLGGRCEVMPPFPAQSYREYGKYRWHLILRHAEDLSLDERERLLASVNNDWIIDIDPDEIL